MSLDANIDIQTPVSDTLADDLILLSLLLGRFSTRTSNLIEQELRGLADELVRILSNNDFTQSKLEAARSQRVRRLLDEAEVAIRNSFGFAGRTLVRDIKLGIELAAEHAAASLNEALGFERARAPDEDRILGLAGILLVEGKSAIDWWKKIAGDAKFRFVAIIKDGYQRKLGLEDMVRAIRGTGDKQFANGVFGTSWRAAKSLARTAIAAGADLGQQLIWGQHPEAVGKVIQLSILDLKTSDICKSYSRKVWTLPKYEPDGHDLPYAGGTPRHFGCRSIIAPVLKAFAELPARFQTRIAFQRREDAFGGQPPSDLEYDDWLKTQSVARQKAALGGRFDLWQAGGMSREDMLDVSSWPLSIREIRKMLGLS